MFEAGAWCSSGADYLREDFPSLVCATQVAAPAHGLQVAVIEVRSVDLRSLVSPNANYTLPSTLPCSVIGSHLMSTQKRAEIKSHAWSGRSRPTCHGRGKRDSAPFAAKTRSGSGQPQLDGRRRQSYNLGRSHLPGSHQVCGLRSGVRDPLSAWSTRT